MRAMLIMLLFAPLPAAAQAADVAPLTEPAAQSLPMQPPQEVEQDTPPAAPAEPAAPVSGAAMPRGVIQLDETVISGNQELPKVLYILPWREPGWAARHRAEGGFHGNGSVSPPLPAGVPAGTVLLQDIGWIGLERVKE